MHRNPYVWGGLALVALWWLTRDDEKKPLATNGLSSTNPAISGGDSYGQLTTVDVRIDGDQGEVIIDQRDLGKQSSTRMMQGQGLALGDPVSAALNMSIPPRPVLPVKAPKLASVAAPTSQFIPYPRPRFAI